MAAITVDDIIRMMVGRDLEALFARIARRRSPGRPAGARAKGVAAERSALDPHATELRDVSLAVQRGEILGIAGLVGAGRTEFARAIFGADPASGGRVRVEDKPVAIRSPADAISPGIGLVPEDRKQQALFLSQAIRNNVAVAALGKLAGLFGNVSDSKERALVEEYRRALGIRMAGPEQQVGNLSGGNQQKVVLARWLALRPKVLIVDEPTRGIDVGAKAEVHHLLDRLARAGIAVIAISSELPEVLAVGDRIVTMCEGRITGEVGRARPTQETLMPLMTLGATCRRAASQEEGTETAQGTTRPDRGGFDLFGLLAQFAPLIFLVVLMAVFAIAEPRFISTINLFNVLRQVSITGPAGDRHDLRHPDRRHDLSIGAVLAFCGLAAAIVAKGGATGSFTLGADEARGWGWDAAALVSILVGVAAGAVQGFCITRLKVPPFVVTLGGMSVFRGAALLLSGGGPISGFDADFHCWGQGKIGPVPGTGDHLPRLRRARRYRAALHARFGRAGLCRRRQSGGGAPVRPQRLAHHPLSVCR